MWVFYKTLHQQKDYDLLKVKVMISILAIKHLKKIKVCTLGFFRHNAMHYALNRLQYSINITFICTGKLKMCVTRFNVIFTLLWTKIAISLKYSCTVFFYCYHSSLFKRIPCSFDSILLTFAMFLFSEYRKQTHNPKVLKSFVFFIIFISSPPLSFLHKRFAFSIDVARCNLFKCTSPKF